MAKIKKLFKNVRVIILIVALVLMVVAVHPNPWVKGVTIRNVMENSSASLAGIESPKPTAPPMSRERITAINNIAIDNIEDFYSFTAELKQNRTVQIKTNKGLYKLVVKEGEENLGLNVYDCPKTNIRKGLDLQGGTRVLLQPAQKLSSGDMSMLLDNMKRRLNIYGLADVVIKPVNDLPPPLGSGNQYILIEIAGAQEEEAKELLSKQGKFEAKIENASVFLGGTDITYVCRTADCSGLDPQRPCGRTEDGQWVCRFRFTISRSPEAAVRQAELTKDLEVITENGQEYLSKDLDLYLDNVLVDSLKIGSELKGKAVTDIQITGPGSGATEQEAAYNALKNMKKLQTILVTGSLPVKLDIVKTDAISPVLGVEFVKNAILMGIVAIVVVGIVIFVKYKKFLVTFPMLVATTSEVILLLGVAALIGWNIDVAAIAGIIIAVGTGVDHQIVIADETIKGTAEGLFDWKSRIKKAFFIIMGAYLTTMVAMVPLLFAGAGLIKGFALTTMIGVTIGVFITRPAFAAMIEILLKR